MLLAAGSYSKAKMRCKFSLSEPTFAPYLSDTPLPEIEEVVSDDDMTPADEKNFADNVARVVKELNTIFKKPHLFLKREELVQHVSVATHITSELLRENVKDTKLWRTTDRPPEYIHTFVYEDEYAIYENRFLTFLIDTLCNTIGRRINKLKSGLPPINEQISTKVNRVDLTREEYRDFSDTLGDTPLLVSPGDEKVYILASYLKSRKRLVLLKAHPIYKACKKAPVFNIRGLKSTNILMNEMHYNYCYIFYLKYLRSKKTAAENKRAIANEEFIKNSIKFYHNYTFFSLLDAFYQAGFLCEEPTTELAAPDDFSLIRFRPITWNKGAFSATLEQMDDIFHYTLTIRNMVTDSVVEYTFRTIASTDDKAAELLAHENRKEMAKDDMVSKTFIMTDLVSNSRNVITVQQGVPSDRLAKLINSLVYLAEGATSIYLRICPLCGSSFVIPQGPDFSCTSCDGIYNLFRYETRNLIWVKKFGR